MSKAETETDTWYSTGEAARLLRVDVRTVQRWEKKGYLSATRTPGGHRRYPAAQIHALLGVPPPTHPHTSTTPPHDSAQGQDSDQAWLLTRGEAAELLGVDVSTLLGWEESGALTPLRTPSGRRRYLAEQVHALRKGGPSTSPDHLAGTAVLEFVIGHHFGGDPVAAMLALAARYGIAVAYLDRQHFTTYLKEHGHALTDKEWERIAPELADFCHVIDDVCAEQITDYTRAVLAAASVGPSAG